MKRIIKLNAIDSTNAYIRQMNMEEKLDDYTVVMTKFQTQGRGQLGTVWHSQEGKNLMFSVFKRIPFVPSEHAFYLSIVTALAIVKTLKGFNIPKLKVKWPNDILSENKKICGILIENVLYNNQMKETIIGIGLNVNQTEFENLPQASSLLLISGRVHDTEELLHSIIKNLKHYFSFIKQGKYESLLSKYENLLFRKDKPSTFKSADGTLFTGLIQGITQTGSLKILLEDNVCKEFELKQVSLLY
ncbi:MAG: biotin--[acetyl-CoA-carboxylase] ligase [Flavobacteriaceae bacterium]|nr:biotin--[acetyl-CoA-carboxylase] ligase [Mangrovimonas sp.]MCB0437820.1 biotin--[acetyl-CoA-carboxylase] ligase [Mangrovimonas sp.]MCB0470470.1 biotin--[acetyl-CoA-carboxylase] ligase [Flavobacteriaceae bacterium]HPF96946.1 biotin--[acetyl-CoA-carboxylase] ligase [Mangrovimonas sp.]HRV55062.1 biotin--[acetyl-CoA-carboxylase] ligase [Mangrovimonas sp.]